jgi:hypothetical protein
MQAPALMAIKQNLQIRTTGGRCRRKADIIECIMAFIRTHQNTNGNGTMQNDNAHVSLWAAEVLWLSVRLNMNAIPAMAASIAPH